MDCDGNPAVRVRFHDVFNPSYPGPGLTQFLLPRPYRDGNSKIYPLEGVKDFTSDFYSSYD